jgi:hypothetical protein
VQYVGLTRDARFIGGMLAPEPAGAASASVDARLESFVASALACWMRTRSAPDANSFQREIVDRALPLYYILTDLGQQDEPFSDHSLNSILRERRDVDLVVFREHAGF